MTPVDLEAEVRQTETDAIEVISLTSKEGLRKYAKTALARLEEETRRRGHPSDGCIGMLRWIAEEVSR